MLQSIVSSECQPILQYPKFFVRNSHTFVLQTLRLIVFLNEVIYIYILKTAIHTLIQIA